MSELTIIIYPDSCSVALISEREDNQYHVKHILAQGLTHARAVKFVERLNAPKNRTKRKPAPRRSCRICGEPFQPYDNRASIGPCCIAAWRSENIKHVRAKRATR